MCRDGQLERNRFKTDDWLAKIESIDFRLPCDWTPPRLSGGVKGPTEVRDGETTEESGDAVLTLPQRCALLTTSGLLCRIQWGFPEGSWKRFGRDLSSLACVIHLDQSDHEPSNTETWISLIGRADRIIQSNGLEGDHQTD